MPVLLASYKNKTAGFVLRENKKQITIGRDPGNDMPLPMSRVSRVHATLTCKNHEWFIRDLGSFNGTKINNVRVKGRSAIEPGDRLRLGNVRLQFMDTDKIPEGIKRLKDRRDNTERVKFKCKYCSQSLKAMARDAGRRVQCHHCDQVVHVPGHVVGKSKKNKQTQRPENPLLLMQDDCHQSQMMMSPKINEKAQEHIALDDVHDELAAVQPQTSVANKEAAVDQAQAMRQLRRAEVKRELFRDDRNVVEKLYSKALISFVLQYSKLKDPSFPVHRWHVAAMFMVLVCFMSIRMILGGGGPTVAEAAPSEFTVTCLSCDHQSHMKLDRFEQLSFYMMHPDSYGQKYPGQTIPDPSVCSDCGITHTALRLTVDPDTGQRQVVALTDKDNDLQLAKAQ